MNTILLIMGLLGILSGVLGATFYFRAIFLLKKLRKLPVFGLPIEFFESANRIRSNYSEVDDKVKDFVNARNRSAAFYAITLLILVISSILLVHVSYHAVS